MISTPGSLSASATMGMLPVLPPPPQLSSIMGMTTSTPHAMAAGAGVITSITATRDHLQRHKRTPFHQVAQANSLQHQLSNTNNPSLQSSNLPSASNTQLGGGGSNSNLGAVTPPFPLPPQTKLQQQQQTQNNVPHMNHANGSNMLIPSPSKNSSGNNSNTGSGNCISAAAAASYHVGSSSLKAQVAEKLGRDELRERSIVCESEAEARNTIAERFEDSKSFMLRLAQQRVKHHNSLELLQQQQQQQHKTAAALQRQSTQQHHHHHHHQPQQAVTSIVSHRACVDELRDIMRNTTKHRLFVGEPQQQQKVTKPCLGAAVVSSFSSLVDHRAEEFCALFLQLSALTEPAELLCALRQATALLSEPAVAQEVLIAGRFSQLKRELDRLHTTVRRAREEGLASSPSSSSAAAAAASSATAIGAGPSSAASVAAAGSAPHQQLQALAVTCARAPLLPVAVILAVIREQEAMDERAAAMASASSASSSAIVDAAAADGDNDWTVFPIATAAAALLDAFGRAYQHCNLTLAKEKVEIAQIAVASSSSLSTNATRATITASAAPAAADQHLQDSLSEKNDQGQAMVLQIRQAHSRSVTWLLGWSGHACPAVCSLARNSMDDYRSVRCFDTSRALFEALRALSRFPARCGLRAASWPLLMLVHSVVRGMEAISGVAAGIGIASFLEPTYVATLFSNIAVPLGSCRAHARSRLALSSSSSSPSSSSSSSSLSLDDAVTLLLYAVVTAKVLPHVPGAPTAACTIAADWAYVQRCLDAVQIMQVRERVCRLLEIAEGDFFASLTPRGM